MEPHLRHCVASLSKNINPSLVMVQPRNTHPFITDGTYRISSNKQTNQITDVPFMHKIPYGNTTNAFYTKQIMAYEADSLATLMFYYVTSDDVVVS